VKTRNQLLIAFILRQVIVATKCVLDTGSCPVWQLVCIVMDIWASAGALDCFTRRWRDSPPRHTSALAQRAAEASARLLMDI